MTASRAWTGGLLLAWCLLALGDSAHAGYFSAIGLAGCIAGFLIVAAAVAAGGRVIVPDRTLLVVPAVVCVVAAAWSPTHPFLYLHGADLHAIEALSIVAAVAVGASLWVPPRWQRAAWLIIVGLAAATGITTIAIIGNPNIDVWDILQQSSTGLLHGANMYHQHWQHSTGLQTVYPYLPGSTLLLAPFRWILGDVRYGLLLASVIGALVIRRLASTTVVPTSDATPTAARQPNSAAATCLAGLLLVTPGWALLVNRSWTEPLLVAALAVAILATRAGWSWLAVLALAAALASKQHIVLLVPMFAVWPAFGWRRTASACGLAFLVVLPWLAAGPHAFWHDAVHANLGLGAETNALSLQALLLRHGVSVGGWFVAVIVIGTYALVLWRAPRTLSGLALGSALVMWAFDLANTQTFFNHYMLPLGLVLLALATAEPQIGAMTSD